LRAKTSLFVLLRGMTSTPRRAAPNSLFLNNCSLPRKHKRGGQPAPTMIGSRLLTWFEATMNGPCLGSKSRPSTWRPKNNCSIILKNPLTIL